nr:hypothetical protein [uncultured Actinomyces sp.]
MGKRILGWPRQRSVAVVNSCKSGTVDGIESALIHECVRRMRFDQIPALIKRGADINERNASGETPLFEVVKSLSVVDVEQMILWGADPRVTASSQNYGEVTLVEYILSKSGFVDTPRVLAVIRLLLSFGAPAGDRVMQMLQSKDRERCRFITHGLPQNITRAEFDASVESLRKLFALFGLDQREAKPALKIGERLDLDSSVPPLRQYGELWDRLVPDSGRCETLQGEVIRIVGEISNIVCGERREKRGSSLRVLLDQYIRLISFNSSSSSVYLSRAKAVVVSLQCHNAGMKSVNEIVEIAVEWVRLNPVLRAADIAFEVPLWKKPEILMYRVLDLMLLVVILCISLASWAALLSRVNRESGGILTIMYIAPVALLLIVTCLAHVRNVGQKRFVTTMRLIFIFVYVLTFLLVCQLLRGEGMAFFLGFGEVGPSLVSTYEVFFVYCIFCVCSLFQCWLVDSENWRIEMRAIVGGGLIGVGILMPKLLESYSILRAYCSNRWCLVDEVEGSVLYEMGIAYAVSLLMLFVVGLFPSWFISVIRQITNVWIETPRPVASYLFEGSSELSVGDRVLGGGCG